MTLVSQIVIDAYRQSNLLALGVLPTLDQDTEALRYLNRVVKSVFGNEAGEDLEPFPIGDNNISRPSGFPWADGAPYEDWFVPKNQRLMMNLTQPMTIYLHPMPDDGSRFGIVDVSGNFSTYNVTLDGNGRNIETTSTILLNLNGASADWFYRADLGNWIRTSDLLLTDVFPFPEQFDDLFITMLAMRLNPAYGRTIDGQAQAIMNRSRTQFRAKYTNTIDALPEAGLLRLAYGGYSRGWGNSTSAFNRGHTL